MRKSVIAIIIIVLVVLYMSVFVVKEGERGITLRFGKVLRDDDNKPLVYEPGLHFKIPFIETVKMLDARIQTMDNQADRFVTKEKKDLIVDSYIKWRISDFSRYYLATGGGDISQAEVLLKRKFSDRLRSEIGRLDVKDIVTDSRGRLTLEVRDALNSGSAGTEDEVTTPAADNAIAEAAERVTAETKGKVPVINPTRRSRWTTPVCPPPRPPLCGPIWTMRTDAGCTMWSFTAAARSMTMRSMPPAAIS